MNNIDILTKKYWTRLVIGATVNAAIFVTYRLYINHLKNEKNRNIKNKLKGKTIIDLITPHKVNNDNNKEIDIVKQLEQLTKDKKEIVKEKLDKNIKKKVGKKNKKDPSE